MHTSTLIFVSIVVILKPSIQDYQTVGINHVLVRPVHLFVPHCKANYTTIDQLFLLADMIKVLWEIGLEKRTEPI
jgi:hypothetical protein